jgi:hypothetical protein
MAVAELIAILKPPAVPSEVPKSLNWTAIEAQLGVSLPPDYRDYVEIYGSGLLANFIRVFNPFSASEYLALIPCVRAICETRRKLKQSEGDKEVPYDVYPDFPGILPWGNDENGNTLYWLTKGRASEWPTVVGEGRGRRWQEFTLPTTSFLAKILTGEVKCDIWPQSFPVRPDDYVFQPY